ncbi:MAG TPA: hypothetical protein ENI13_00330 [candidate division CPR3 bacterium]|uniref:Uncharacterized protein n=1 Tax=candidate division CPR3 bacterium TaxID=2268181 RepID=A0A7C1NPF4_UNCC3|nr:hypothetical protein [candidate division CPR3 bacterium]
MTDKQIIEVILEKAKDMGLKFGSNEFRIEEHEKKGWGFWEGRDFYSIDDMMTIRMIPQAIFGRELIELEDGKKMPAYLYHSQVVLTEERPLKYLEKFS